MKRMITAAAIATLAFALPASAQTGGTPAVGTKTPSSASGSMSGNSNVQGSTSMASHGSTNTYGSVQAQGSASGAMHAKPMKTSKSHMMNSGANVDVSADSIDRSGKTQEGGRATAGAQTTQEQAFGAHTPANRGSSKAN